MPNGVNVSRDLRWLLTKNTSCYAVKVRNHQKAFSKDPLNPKGLHLPRFSGTIQSQAVTVRGSAKKPGVTLVYKRRRTVKKPAKKCLSYGRVMSASDSDGQKNQQVARGIRAPAMSAAKCI